MATQFDPELIQTILSRLSRRHAIAFSAACCERLLPNYRTFVEQANWGDWQLLRSTLDEVWSHIAGIDIPTQRFRSLLKRCEAVIPDTNDYGTIEASNALDASSGVCETLRLCIDGDVSHAVIVANAAVDTVDMFIQVRDHMDYADPQFEEKILADSLMVRELEEQLVTLRSLELQVPLEREYVELLRSQYFNKSNVR